MAEKRDLGPKTGHTDFEHPKTNDNPQKAADELGTSLHPIQDWYAHGDYMAFTNGNAYHVHNAPSPAMYNTHGADHTYYPDNKKLDALNGDTYGRPAGAAMKWVEVKNFFGLVTTTQGYAVYADGNKRITGTRDVTMANLNAFKSYVENFGGCRCKQYFKKAN